MYVCVHMYSMCTWKSHNGEKVPMRLCAFVHPFFCVLVWVSANAHLHSAVDCVCMAVASSMWIQLSPSNKPTNHSRFKNGPLGIIKPYLFWHEDFAVGEFFCSFCNSQNWFGLISNGFKASAQYFNLKDLHVVLFHSQMFKEEVQKWRNTETSIG